MNIEKLITDLLGQREIFGFFNYVQSLDIKIDEFFGVESTEERVSIMDQNLYAGLKMQALSTSYLDYYQVLQDLDPGDTLVDIGAGYCRGTLLAKFLYKKCISLEVDKSRSMLAKNKYPKDVLQFDLREKELPIAIAYFIYLPWGELTNTILTSIYERNIKCYLYIIESHGDFIENLNIYKEFKLLSDELKVSTERHKSSIYKYEFIPSPKYGKINKYSFKDIESIPYWILKYQKNINKIKILSKTPDEKSIEWCIEIKNTYACVYYKKESIFIPSCSRYLQYQYDTIVDIIT